MMPAAGVSVSRCLKVVLICCWLVDVLVVQSEVASKKTEQKSHEAILRDYAVDLKRLTSVVQANGQEQSDQSDQLASANHESFVLDNSAQQSLLSQLLMASASAPLPAGRRRLDDSPLVTLPTGPVGSLANLRGLGPARHQGANNARRRNSNGQYKNIVDNGSASPNSNSIPYPALVAMMTNNNFNRMALASAMRSQRSQVDEASAKRRRQHKQQEAKMANRKRQPASNLGRQESKVNNKRMRGGGRAGEKLNDFNGRGDGAASGNEIEDYDDDRGVDDEDQERGASRRQAKDDFFNDDDDEDDGNGGGSRSTSKSASPGKRSQLKQAASRQLPNRRKKTDGRSSGDNRATSGDSDDQPEEDEDIDSTNARQVASRPDPPARQAPLLKAKVIKRRSDEPQARQLKVATAVTHGKRQQEPMPVQVDDDLSAASHVRNSATDLQTAAGKHYGGHHYHQMIEVPKKKAYKMSFKRGNHKHEIMKHEKLHKHKFHTKFAWHAKEKCKKKKKCKSVGKMTWEYKHDKKHHHHRR